MYFSHLSKGLISQSTRDYLIPLALITLRQEGLSLCLVKMPLGPGLGGVGVGMGTESETEVEKLPAWWGSSPSSQPCILHL